jgi:transcriptional regulator with PAS, ATPase and Fis domain
VTAEPEEDGVVQHVLGTHLRAMDVTALFAPHHYENLVVGVDVDTAHALADAIRISLEERDVRATVAVAMFPSDARTAYALVAVARRREDGNAADEPSNPAIVPVASVLDRMRPLVERIAASDISVLVLGETGVGKELLSRMVHDLSPRRARTFLSVNCAALGESLLESELFGYERGAFTGAVQAKQGLIEAADGGTLFLDEVGEMPLNVQAKLLRVLEAREVMRLGAVRPKTIDVRFVAATNRDLETEVAAGRFREDVYFRLNGVALVLPPLRDRMNELEQLSAGILAQACARMGREVPKIAPEALALMRRYSWPGNVRELRNVLERAIVLCSGDVITLAHLPTERLGRGTPPPPSDREVRRAREAVPTPVTPMEAFPSLRRGFDGTDAERRKIEDALAQCGGNQTLAARLLGVSRGTLVSRITQYALPRPRKPGGR